MSFTSNTVDMTGACHECCGGTCCDCAGSTLTFTISGVTEGSVGSTHEELGCDSPSPELCCFCEIYNDDFTLTEYDFDDEDPAPCDGWRYFREEIQTCAGQTNFTITASCVGGILGIGIFAGVDPIANYFGPMFCDGPSILEWDSTQPDAFGSSCTTWPATITVTHNP